MEFAIPNPAPLELRTQLHAAVLSVSATGSLEETLLSVTDGARNIAGAHHATGVFFPQSDGQSPLVTTALSSEYQPYRVYFNGLDPSVLNEVVAFGGVMVRLLPGDQLPEASLLHANRRGLLAPPIRAGLIASLVSRAERPLGLIYVTGKLEGEFSRNDAEQLRQFAEIGASLLELHQVGASPPADSAHPGADDLARANREMLRCSEDLDQFANVSTHDLQNQLRAVVGYCQLVKAAFSANSAAGGKSAQIAVEGANSLQQFVNDLLSIQRSRQADAPIGIADCNQVVADALRNLSTMLDETHAIVRCDPLPVVRGDLRQLTQLFENLIENAIAYRSKRPIIISISATENDKEWAFSVGDRGIGVAAGLRQRIFTIFQRDRTRNQPDGTGIGLAVCKRIIDRHGGRIWIAQNTGGGSTVRFTLPRDL
jgi:signal transduction histidine kinase